MAGRNPPGNIGDGVPLVRTGDVVSGKFRIERVLGQGGMGVVVAAKHLQLDEMVALKFLRAHAVSDPDALARFTREARAAAKLKSEHVARVLDAGVTEEGTPYIVMEYLEGRTLGEVVESEGRIDAATVAEYAIQACEGLAEAHARGIVHRDIKPENLFLVERSQAWRVLKILDFGISKFDARGASESNISTQGMMGSPCYMSPEQLRSTADVDHRTDIWSLGATVFELLAGGTAYSAGQTLPQLIAAILEQPTPRLTEFWSDIPPELSAVVARCMAKDREARFESAAELALALLPFAPKRVRANVERAIAVTQAVVPSSLPIAPLWSDAPPPIRDAMVGPSSRGPVSGTLRSATSQKAPEAVDNLDTLAAPTMPVSAERTRARLPRFVLAGVAASAALVVVWRLVFHQAPSSAPPGESAWPVAATRVDPVTPASAPKEPLPVSVSAEAAHGATSLPSGPSPSSAPTGALRPQHRPVAAPRLSAAASPSSVAPASLDIRMER